MQHEKKLINEDKRVSLLIESFVVDKKTYTKNC